MKKTVLFATSYCGHPCQLSRYRSWLDYYLPRLDKLGADKIFLIDDGSKPEYLSKLGIPIINLSEIKKKDYPQLTEKAYIFRFPDNLGRPTKTIIPGWWRSFSFMSILAYNYSIDKLIHIESDTFILTDILFDYIREQNKLWTALYSYHYRWAETAIQIIPKYSEINWYYPGTKEPKNNFKEMFNYFIKGNEFWYKDCLGNVEYIPEYCLPFDEVSKDFFGDRYGEDWCKEIPDDIDYLVNVNDVSLGNIQHQNLIEKLSTIIRLTGWDKRLDELKQKGNLSGFHSGDMGDVCYGIPLFKKIGIKKLILNPFKWWGTKFTKQNCRFIKPLLESEGFEVEILDDPEKIISYDIDLDRFRNIGESLLFEHLGVTQGKAQLEYFLPMYQPWLKNEQKNKQARVVINQSMRYPSSFFQWTPILLMLKKLNEKAVFVGLFDEFEDFLAKHPEGKGIVEYYPVLDALELKKVIAGADVFIGNQSFAYSIAEGLKVNRIQASCEYNNNSMPFTDNGLGVINEKGMQTAIGRLKTWLI